MDRRSLSILYDRLARQELPGDKAHARLSSYSRPRAEQARQKASDPKESAVLLLLYPDEKGQLHTILIQRPAYRGVHASQIAFPGGKREEADPDLSATALRETEEEVGIERERIQLIGALSEIFIPPSGYIVKPYVAHIADRPRMVREPAEVDAIHEVPLDRFIGDKAIEKTKVRAGKDGVILTVPAYLWEGITIWGATAMMLSELSMLLEEEQPPFTPPS